MKMIRVFGILLLLLCCHVFWNCVAFAETIKLPDKILTIEDESFLGTASIEEVIIPEGTERIGHKAFAYSGLKTITIPESVMSIEQDAFLGVDGMTIYCSADSYARKFADVCGLSWIDISPYSSVIEKYRNAYLSGNANNDYHNESYAYKNGISSYIGYSSHVGYCYRDLDGDGTPELLIAGIDPRYSPGQELFDLYTLHDDTLINLATSHLKQRYYLKLDNTILFTGTGGAPYHQWALKRIRGDELIPIKAIFTYYGYDNDSNTYFSGYYYQEGYTTYEPNESSVELDEESFNNKRYEYESDIYVPPLIMIA